MLVVAAPLIYLGIHFSSAGDKGAATGPLVNEPGYAQPKNAPFTKVKQREVSKVLREFILTAVDRQDVGRSWAISAPSLREGFTKKQWSRGDLPVVPYPAANRGLGRWSFVQYSYSDTIGLEVFLFPKPGSGWSAMTADVELVKGHDGNWRVDYWMPKRFHGPPALAKAKPTAKAQGEGRKGQGEGDEPPRRGEAARCSAGSCRCDAEAEPSLVDPPDRAALADRARAARDRPQLLVPKPTRGARLPPRPRRLLGLGLFEEPLPAGDQAL